MNHDKVRQGGSDKVRQGGSSHFQKESFQLRIDWGRGREGVGFQPYALSLSVIVQKRGFKLPTSPHPGSATVRNAVSIICG